MRLGWGVRIEGIGNNLGYATQDQHLRAALEQLGHTIADEAPITVFLTPPYFFRPRRFTANVLYTMWEFSGLPDEMRVCLDTADLIVVPCEHNRELFSYYTHTPVEICGLGVVAQNFPLIQRHFPADGEPFVFLFVGANNARKGTVQVWSAWKIFAEQHPELRERVRLVMKMTENGKSGIEQVASSAFVDWRVLPGSIEEATKVGLPPIGAVYHYAHCFLFPSLGEGFGLTLAEALATGLPAIYTPHSGPEDFLAEENGYPLYYGERDLILCDDMGRQYGITTAANPDVDHLAERMYEVYTHYDDALARGLRAAARVRSFTWERCAGRFTEILMARFGEEACAG